MNPLKNNQVLFRLNPYAQAEKRKAQTQSSVTREKVPKKKIVYKTPAIPEKTKDERKAERLAKQAALPKAVKVPKEKKEKKKLKLLCKNQNQLWNQCQNQLW